MRIIFLSLFGLFFATGFVGAQDAYFEGVVVYEMSYEPEDESIDKDAISSFRAFEIMFFKDGSYRKEVYTSSRQLVEVSIYHVDSVKMYTLSKIQDSISVSDVALPSEGLEFKNKVTTENAEIIYELDCTSVKTELKNIENDSRVEFTYYFSDKYKLNPDWYAEFASGFYNQINENINGVNLGLDIYYEGIILEKARAVQVDPRPLPDLLFNPKNITKNINDLIGGEG